MVCSWESELVRRTRVRHGWSVPYADSRLGHQFMVGPGSVEPVARQGRAGGKLETSPPVAPLEQGERSPGG